MSSPTASLNILIYRGDFNADFTGVQALFETIRHIPDLTRHIPGAYSVIEEIVEGFVEGFLTSLVSKTVAIIRLKQGRFYCRPP